MRNLQKMREYFDEHRVAIHTELAKHGIPVDVDSNDRGELIAHRADLRRAVNTHRDSLLAVTNKKGQTSQKENEQFEAELEVVNHLNVLIDMDSHFLDMKELGEKLTASQGSLAAPWKNGEQVVKPLAKSERFSNSIEGRSGQSMGFGEYVRAMVAGTNRQEIRDALVEGTDSAGGYTVPRHLLAQLIDAMRARTVAVQAGALTIPLETEKTTIARLDSDPQAGWRLERAAVAEANPTFGAVQFTARSLACMVKISRELLDDSINIDAALMTAFAGAMAGELDRVALFGSGAAPEPRGLCNTSGISTVSVGQNGAVLSSFAPLLDALYETESANARAPTAWIMAPRTSRTLNGLVDTTGQPLNAPQAVSSIPRLVTTQVPINQTHGTASNASSIILGDFSQLLIGVRTQLRIEVIRELFASTLEYAFLAHLRADVAVAQPKAFCVVQGIKPQ